MWNVECQKESDVGIFGNVNVMAFMHVVQTPSSHIDMKRHGESN